MIWRNILEIIGYILAGFIIILTAGAIEFCFLTIVAGVINDRKHRKANKKYTIDVGSIREDIRRMDGSGGKRGQFWLNGD